MTERRDLLELLEARDDREGVLYGVWEGVGSDATAAPLNSSSVSHMAVNMRGPGDSAVLRLIQDPLGHDAPGRTGRADKAGAQSRRIQYNGLETSSRPAQMLVPLGAVRALYY